MKLGRKGKDVETFVDQLKSEGETVISPTMNSKTSSVIAKVAPPVQHTEPYVMLKCVVCNELYYVWIFDEHCF